MKKEQKGVSEHRPQANEYAEKEDVSPPKPNWDSLDPHGSVTLDVADVQRHLVAEAEKETNQRDIVRERLDHCVNYQGSHQYDAHVGEPSE